MTRKPRTTQKQHPNTQDLNPGSRGAPFQEQDIKRRLGNFEGAGEHAKKGSRSAGIVGQTKRKSRTDKRAGS